MKSELNRETYQHFEDRFGNLHDAIVEEVYLKLSSHHQSIVVRLLAEDYKDKENVQMATLFLEFGNIIAFQVSQLRLYRSDLIFKALFRFTEEVIFADLLSPSRDITIDDFATKGSENKKSDFKILASNCYWYIED
jgi:hypothetical protein